MTKKLRSETLKVPGYVRPQPREEPVQMPYAHAAKKDRKPLLEELIRSHVTTACGQRKKGQASVDGHHFAGRANSPIRVPTPVNDCSPAQRFVSIDWPKKTRENPEGSPFLAAAGCEYRGFIDYVHYLIVNGLAWVAEMLEAADALLALQLGPKWWVGTELEKFAPKPEPK